MPLAVLPAQVADIEPVYDVYFAAFKNEPIIDFLYPGGVDRKAHTEGTKQWWSHDRIGYTVKCLDTDTGEIVGMATWDIFWKSGKDNGWERPAGIPWLEGEEKARCEDVLNNMWDIRDKLFGKRHRYIYLSVIAVDPKHQRRGIGRLLMQWGIDVAEQLQLPIYTEASESGLRLYESVRFERLTQVKLVHKEEVTGRPDVEIPLVVRMPSSAKGLRFEEWVNNGYPQNYQIHVNGNGKVNGSSNHE
ncbi:acyl-CoA N-acyltransferase [Hypoxylon trugodes]|uniref:acyl-CoA N-acyltransferase n=1 Tax=Hypoxylon trugodes TaxID=326681 RepID=UPI00219CA4BC|nr:acyl-CoA N-acyltransferase [Hypoxylon trugodes]KAI1393733.1 acyl-CoA N-acyltransferase [Hypoxylon trugodes]